MLVKRSQQFAVEGIFVGTYRSSGPPAWLVFLIATAFAFGGYYLYLGARNFLRTGGLGVIEATEQAEIVATATAERVIANLNRTPMPSSTPLPECQDFIVSVPSAIVREAPNTNAAIVTAFDQGTTICVIDRDSVNTEWFLIDSNPETRRYEYAYMHESIIQAVNPTPTITPTTTPPPTVTQTPSLTPTISPTPRPTLTPDPNATDTPTPTVTPSVTPLPTATDAFQSA